MSKVTKAMFMGLVLLIMSTFAYGKDDPVASGDWDFTLAPLYLWAVKMDGNMTVRGRTQSLKLDFDEIFDKLEAAYTVHFEGFYKRKWGFLFDLSYVNIGDSITTPGPRAATINVDFVDTLIELGAIYRFYNKGRHMFEGLGGVRYTDLDTEIDTVGGPGPLPVPPKIEANQDWLDLIIGLRYRWQISEKWMLSLRGDIGGFGIGDASDFTWNAIGLIHWKPWKHVGFLGGYRALYQDYETGSGIDVFKYDMLMHGPILAVKFTW